MCQERGRLWKLETRPPEPGEGAQPCAHLDVGPRGSLLASDLQTVRQKCVLCEATACGGSYQQPWETKTHV